VHTYAPLKRNIFNKRQNPKPILMLNSLFHKVNKRLISSYTALLIGTCVTQAAPQKPYTIGVSNSYVNVWRSQMLNSMQKLGDDFKGEGLIKPLMIESGTVDIQGQIAQIRNLIARKVDALIVFPISATALNPVLDEASRSGILVIAALSPVSDAKILNISIDQAEWARISARWLNQTLQGHGDVVLMNGLAGHPDNEARFNAVKEVFSASPDIHLIPVNGDWDGVKAQQVMSNLLAGRPRVDGVWVSGDMSAGVVKAIMAANPATFPAVTGDGNLAYLRLWKEVKATHPEFRSIAHIDPPSLAATASLRCAIYLLEGKQLKDGIKKGKNGNAIYLPGPSPVSEEQLPEKLEEFKDAPDTRFLDQPASAELVESFFKTS
jgi:ribose transport system substrate-binding protein